MAQGTPLTLAASAARTATGTGSTVDLVGELGYIPERLVVMLATTAHATDAGDTLDLTIETSLDASTWIESAHMTQIAGNATPPLKYYAYFNRAITPGTSTLNATTNPAAGAQVPYILFRYIRAKWTMASAGDANTSHTFSVVAYEA